MTGDTGRMPRILEAVALQQRGDNAEARSVLIALWHETEENHALERCILAHYLADLETSLEGSLQWNRLALSAAETLRALDVEEVFPGVALRAFFPSLHLNLAEDYRLLGDRISAGRHLAEARAALTGLEDEGLVGMIRGGVERMERTLSEAAQLSSSPLPSAPSSSTTGIA